MVFEGDAFGMGLDYENWAFMNGMSGLKKERAQRVSKPLPTCEDKSRWHLSAPQKVGSHQNRATLAIRSWTFSPQNCEKYSVVD